MLENAYPCLHSEENKYPVYYFVLLITVSDFKKDMWIYMLNSNQNE